MPPDEEVPEMAEASAAATATASRRVVTVYASSSSHIDRVFFEAAHELGMLIARRGWVQLNGGGRTGLMGAATDGGVQAGGAVDAVIPKMFHKVNESGNLRHVTVTEDMRDRKQGLLDRCEAIICLPGGLGTLEEAFEALSWRQLGLHNKPLVFLNVAGFYSGLETFLRSTQEAGFISERMKDAYMFCESPAEAIDFIENHEPAVVAKSDLHTIHSGGMLGHIRELQSDWEVAAQTSERLSQHAETSRK
ncbi:putative cytokinin riboside 5'-monophosphate phosphoribohydrolase LOGL2 [Porphyridium purpureum]|uniref:Putative cytokinin riboside 5'-monophosphate phosphoribohydrolase LOGL2 n=1 Tax=Porphyridium purpureum TaxID=35688 RepID=A0A5J4Z943_PORPP|nr:putative cytokinin riboside 5'-monophosphate phosphoribohydrolase LOGL2 [Porphyridium purpureum]|eukprot:POR1850..scf295_1